MRSALVYPLAVITIAVIVVYVILWKVIPVFAALFEGLGAQLPFLTRFVVALSNFIGRFWWLIFLLVFASIFALRQYYQTEQGRYQIDKLMLRMPAIGILLRKIAVARFCRTLGTLMASGVAILEVARHHRQDLRKRRHRRGGISRSARRLKRARTSPIR